MPITSGYNKTNLSHVNFTNCSEQKVLIKFLQNSRNSASHPATEHIIIK